MPQDIMRQKTITDKFLNVKHFYQQLPKQGRLLGLDISKNNIGIAISDENWQIAVPMKIIKRHKFTQDIKEIIDIVKRKNIIGYIIGWPLHLNGTISKQCQSIKDFQEELAKYLPPMSPPMPCLFWDERLTTVQAKKTGTTKIDAIDDIAANIILQSAIERIKKEQHEQQ